jgi:PadR family transcriptional regulator, regulatory protein PadR
MTTQTLRILSGLTSDLDREWYGLELSKRSGLKPGTIYPILNRLLKAGWVERRWEEIDPVAEGRPRRRLYRLTRIGVPAATAALEEHLASLDRPTVPPTPEPKLGLA